MPATITVERIETPEQAATARELFVEYAEAIGVDLEYQGFAAELAGLPSPYVAPHGALLIARIDGQVAGCVALRRLDASIAEMKRLYARPQFRGYGLGERLVGEVIAAARNAGYTALRLDTLATMQSAQKLYAKLGFVEIPAYNNTHIPGTRFYQLDLTK
jgi:putative acetyltransferase